MFNKCSLLISERELTDDALQSLDGAAVAWGRARGANQGGGKVGGGLVAEYQDVGENSAGRKLAAGAPEKAEAVSDDIER